MRWIALALALLATPVEAHCYSRWFYPWPQSCGRIVTHATHATRAIPNQEHPGNEARLVRLVHGPDLEIPLPSLARADLDGGEADEPTRARLLLRVALEAAR